MTKYDLIILTDSRYTKDDNDPYKHNVFYEDDLVLQAAKKLGLKVNRLPWDDQNIDWSSTKAVLFRSTWDYFDRFPEFSNWLEKLSQQTTLINSEALIRWNLDKHYLLDLAEKEIHIPPTEFIEMGSSTTLKALHEKLGWKQTVLKPCVSGGGRHTYKLTSATIDSYEDLFKTVIQEEAMMLQTFQQNIVDQGEISLMLFNGQFTHAILKKAKRGDFRVQDDFGGSVHNYTPTSQEIEFAKQAVLACPEMPTYARVDVFYDNYQTLALGELELIEPELWFRHQKDAAELLAQHLKTKIDEL